MRYYSNHFSHRVHRTHYGLYTHNLYKVNLESIESSPTFFLNHLAYHHLIYHSLRFLYFLFCLSILFILNLSACSSPKNSTSLVNHRPSVYQSIKSPKSPKFTEPSVVMSGKARRSLLDHEASRSYSPASIHSNKPCISLLQQALKNDPQLHVLQQIQHQQKQWSHQGIWPKVPQLRGRIDARTPQDSVRLGTRFYLPWGRSYEKSARIADWQASQWQQKDFALQVQHNLSFAYLDYQSLLLQLWIHQQHYLLLRQQEQEAHSLYKVDAITTEEWRLAQQVLHTQLSAWHQTYHQAQKMKYLLQMLSTPRFAINHTRSNSVDPTSRLNHSTSTVPHSHTQALLEIDPKLSHHSSHIALCLSKWPEINHQKNTKTNITSAQNPQVLMQYAHAQAQSYRAQIDSSLWFEFIDFEWDQQDDTDRALVSFGLNFPWYDEKSRSLQHEARLLQMSAQSYQHTVEQQSQQNILHIQSLQGILQSSSYTLQNHKSLSRLKTEFSRLKESLQQQDLKSLSPFRVRQDLSQTQVESIHYFQSLSKVQRKSTLSAWQWITGWYLQRIQLEKYWIEWSILQGKTLLPTQSKLD
jgi:hypothetical protein